MFIEIKDVKKHYGEGDSRVEVLKGIDIEIEKGEICVLLGPSGSGKSTLLNIIGGIDEADEGYISINGEKTANMNERGLTEYRRKHLGYVFQMYNLIPNLNIRENIEVGAYLSDKPLDTEELIRTLGLFEHRHKLPNQLSGGQQQRCSIGRAIVKNSYDALVIAIGASTDKKMGIEGEDAEGVVSAVSFLKECGRGGGASLEGKEICVIGGGNVSMDAVRTAVRKGAKKVSIVYRRRIEDMTALRAEIDSAAQEGVVMQILKAPSKIEKDDKAQVKGLWVTPQMIGKIKNGRASVKPTGDEDIMLPCDMVIVAIGQDIVSEPFARAGVPVSERNTILADKFGTFNDVPGVFAGGDCASGPATVVRAIAAAKVLAKNIDEYLGFNHEISCDVLVPLPNISDREPCGRVNMVERPSCDRKCDFDGVEIPMTKAECKQEAERCLRCDQFGYGVFKGGRQIQC